MNIKDLYKFIKPFIDIYFNKYFGEKKNFINEMISILKDKAKEESTKSSIDKKTCDIIYTIYYLSLFIIFILLIILIIYLIYINTYYSINATFVKMLKNQLKLQDIPEFNQLKNIIYITDNFSFDMSLLTFIIIICIILYFGYYFHFKLDIKNVYKKKMNMKSFPMIFIQLEDNTYSKIGGCSDLELYLEKCKDLTKTELKMDNIYALYKLINSN